MCNYSASNPNKYVPIPLNTYFMVAYKWSLINFSDHHIRRAEDRLQKSNWPMQQSKPSCSSRVCLAHVHQLFVLDRWRVVLCPRQHSSHCIPRAQIPEETSHEQTRPVWSDKHHECQRVEQVPERRLGKDVLLSILILLLFIWVS